MPAIICSGQEQIDVVPFGLLIYADYEKTGFRRSMKQSMNISAGRSFHPSKAKRRKNTWRN